MKYRYLYQDKKNRNCEGEIDARNRADAFTKLRKSGIRPYRVIGDDPYDWRPLVFWFAVSTALVSCAVTGYVLLEYRQKASHPSMMLSETEAQEFRARAREAVYHAPESFRYNVWKGVNARLAERGLAPLPRPEGLAEEDPFGY